jgi:hypothetical protein
MTDSWALVQRLVQRFGARLSVELGLDLDHRPADVERWLLAATLSGTRISASIAVRTYRTLTAAGVRTLTDVRRRSWGELVALLDEGGYVRYDFRTARRLQQLSGVLDSAWGGRLPLASKRPIEERALEAAAHLGVIEHAADKGAGALSRRSRVHRPHLLRHTSRWWNEGCRRTNMTEIDEATVDIPEPEAAPRGTDADISVVDPGADTPPPPRKEPEFGEDPAYDPGGMGRQPDVAEDAEDHS